MKYSSYNLKLQTVKTLQGEKINGFYLKFHEITE